MLQHPVRATWVAMITINGKPAVSYHHSVIRGLKYACWE